MPYDRDDLLDRMDRNLAEHACHLHRSHPRMTVVDTADILISDSGLADDTFNIVARARFTEDTADARIDETIRSVRATNRPHSWWVGPTPGPTDLSTRLVKAGLPGSDPESAMWIDLSATSTTKAVNVPELRIERATTATHLVDYAAIISAGGDPPSTTLPEFVAITAESALATECPARYLVGYVDDEPVATAEVFLYAGVAGIYSVVTRLPFRRRGYGSALMSAAFDLALANAHPIVVLQASAEGEHMYRTLGFHTAGAYVEHPILSRDPRTCRWLDA